MNVADGPSPHSVTINPGDVEGDIAVAINAALADPNVTEVILGPGEFLVHSPIFVPSGKTLTGAGKDLTMIRCADDFDRPGVGEADGVVNTAYSATGVTLSDFSVDASKLSPDGFRLVGVFMRFATGFEVTNVDVYNTTGYAHFVQGNVGAAKTYAGDGTYTGCTVYNAHIAFEQMFADGVTLTDCHVRDGDGDLVGSSFHPLTASKNIFYINCTSITSGNVGFELTSDTAALENIQIINCIVEMLAGGSAFVAAGPNPFFGVEIVGSSFIAHNYVGARFYGVIGTATDSYFQGESIGAIFFPSPNGTPSQFTATNSYALGLRDPAGNGAAYGLSGSGTILWDGGTIEARARLGLMHPLGSTFIQYTEDTELVRTGYGATLRYTEEDAPTAIFPAIALTGPGAAGYEGATLTVSFMARGRAADLLAIADQGEDGAISVDGSQISYEGTVIGTWSGGGADDLVILLNADATDEAVQALARAVTYESSSDDPSAASRIVDFLLADAAGAVARTSAAIIVTGVDDQELLAIEGAHLVYTENGAPALIAPEARFTNIDGAKLAGGTLLVSITAGGTVNDIPSINSVGTGPGQIALNGRSVTYGGVEIGRLTSGIVTFNANATAAAVEALVRRYAFFSPSEDPVGGTREVTFTIVDADGRVTSATASVTVVEVDDIPIAGDTVAQTTEDAATTIAVTVTDFDGGPGPTVASIDGRAIAVGETVTLASGATVTLNEDGTLAYDPNGSFAHLAGPDSGAANVAASDSFRYTLATGGSAEVTVTVAGVASAGDQFHGSAGDDTISGSDRSDLFRLEQGGDDVVLGGAGGDGFFFGGALTADDRADGGEGKDQLALQGNYNLVLGEANFVGVETLALLSGEDTRFGASGTERFAYVLTSVDQNVAAGSMLTVTMNGLQPGEDVTFDGSAETDGAFLFYGGRGVDALTGGSGADGFFFGADGQFAATDRIQGGGGTDQLGLRGDYTLVFTATTMTGIETLALLSGKDTRFGAAGPEYNYDITLDDSNVARGQRLSVNGNGLQAGETIRLDGSAETDGWLRIVAGMGADELVGGAGDDWFYGNGGADRLKGGAGADTFFYRTASESTSTGFDTIEGFDWSEDLLDLPSRPTAVRTLADGALNAATFDSDLAAALDGAVGAGEAALFTASDGDMAGRTFLVVDANEEAGYQAGADYVFELVDFAAPPADLTTDFFI